MKNFDLNLLRVFHTIVEEKSVLRASQKLNVTQSAVSHSLARLRELLGDEVFIRVGSQMLPTERALELAPAIGNALLTLDSVMDFGGFDPLTATRSFTIAANDLLTELLMPRVLEILRTHAPSVDLIIKPATRIDLAEQIDLGRIDLAIGTFEAGVPRFRSIPLFSYDDVLVTRKDAVGPITLESLKQLTLCVVSSNAEQSEIEGFMIERGLARRSDMYDKEALQKAYASRNDKPRIGLVLPHFLALPALIDIEGFAAIVPRPLARIFEINYPVRASALPFPTEVVEVSALWHVRQNRDLAHSWLRKTIATASAALADESWKTVASYRPT